MNTTAVTIVKESVGWSIGLSILMILAGFLAIVIPQAAGIAVNLLVAWLLIFSGAAHLVFAWHTRTTGGILWGILLGILYVFVGAYLLLHPVAAWHRSRLHSRSICLPKASWNLSWPSCFAPCWARAGSSSTGSSPWSLPA